MMDATRRLRVELAAEDFEALRYFALLRGVSMAAACGKVLAIHADTVAKEFPAVKAHVLAWRQAQSQKPVATDDIDEIPF